MMEFYRLCEDAAAFDIVSTNNKKFSEPDNKKIIFLEQFVDRVRSFSSQYGHDSSISYTAYNLTGSPSKFPDYGDFPQAFVMRTYGPWWNKAPSRLEDYMIQNNGSVISQDYIDLQYRQDVYPIRISIYETYNPGSVIGIWVQEPYKKQWFQLWSGPPQFVPERARIFSPPLKTCHFKTRRVRIEFNHDLLDYYTELDAVLLIGTSELIVPRDHITYHQNLSNLLQELGGNKYNNEDIYNLTPNIKTANQDLSIIKKMFYKYCILYNSQIMNNISNGNLVTTLGQHCHSVPPLEEAFKNFQEFLQKEFPKFKRDLSSSSSICRISSPNDKDVFSILNNDDNRSCGSFSALPDETIFKIFKYLDLKTLCRLCRVNRHLSNIAKDALLYTSLNLKPYWDCLDNNALNYLIPRCQYLQRLDLSWCGNYNMINSKDFVNFIRSCGKLLTHLRLNCCSYMNDNAMLVVTRVCTNLKELCLRNCFRITNYGFSKIERLRCLERLELNGDITETCILCSILRKNPQMKHLNLAGIRERLNMDEIAIELGNSCPKLESVDFWKTQTLTPNGVRALARCVNLREVDFGWCNGMGAPGDSLRELLSSCRYLEKVFLTALRGLTDRDLEPLLLCQRLQQLDLLGARSLTPEMCYGFLLWCPKLEMIDLSFCEGISDSQIQEWQRKYPHISFKRNIFTLRN
ncbi:PREDICTED: F-box/LRR-repeat protein 4 [Polistes dominula]|uniref:F-box/LRR-repeat protein 4 n=1 Tax=Polistes dominula TaxID=743375 RepID=A0ABM1ISB7_POLDO|nr:PREDICTED: F-box/LRR-repeat protein 4 [Polistes dominula]